MTATLVKPLFDLPESIHRIGFVEVLSKAIEAPKDTAEKYVVTPPIRDAFDKALKLVGSSLRDSRSQATFLHGSFGSGKSHFMALLSLMLRGNEDVWRLPDLHPLRAKHDWVGSKKLLQLHFHMVGSESLEEAIFLRYIEFVRRHHEDATVPGLFADEKLFADARKLLEELGEEAFFKPMNAEAGGDAEWKVFGGGSTWDRERFDSVVASSDPAVRETLFSALVKTRFGSYADESRQFTDLDSGLGVIGRHAKELGYEGIALFLDELILWLASRASDVSWFHNEVQKMVKLVESQDSHREIPFVSFIARQRDLSEMVGQDYLGSEDLRVRDSLKWSEGRYETITLEDRNLPAIVKKRVLKPSDDSTEKVLDEAFAKLKRAAGPSWQTMLGQLDAGDFRRLYPFSPALVEALVALSNSLQRERTAIKLLTEILVEHIEELSVGQVVGVGDLYDVLAGGEDTADGVMKSRFESAKQMYTHRFLPVLQQAHQTTTAAKCQRLRPDHPARLGCSNCPQRECRTDNRLVKTLIIAALVPEVSALKDMTASKLVQLNHGSLEVMIGGTEAMEAARRLKNWASEIGQLHVGPGGDPTVRLQLEGVELGPILEQAQHVDTQGARQRVLKNLLFEAMGIDAVSDWGKDHKFKDWRGTDRIGHIRFGNVRKMGPEALRCPEDHDWRLIVDYPFDDKGFGPNDDLEAIERYRDESPSWTLVWLPSFFSQSMNNMLGELVILEHILESNQTARGYVASLSVENQARAINDLHNLRTQKQSRVLLALEQAYGLQERREGDIDSAQSVDSHLHVLKPGAVVRPTIGGNLGTALFNYVPAVLEARYPRHPEFTKKLTRNRVEELVQRFGDIIDSPEKRIPADRTLVEDMRGTLGVLGLVRGTETAVHLVEDKTLHRLENKRRQAASESPEVGEVRRWIDESGLMGLQQEALDLIVRCYARYTARTFVSGGRPEVPKPGKPIPDFIVLEKPDLPEEAAWQKAIDKAGAMLGVTLAGRALNPDNLKSFEGALAVRLSKVSNPCAKLPRLLKERLAELEVSESDRLSTAACAETLVNVLPGRAAKDQVTLLAEFDAKTSERAVGASVGAAADVVDVLEDDLVFGAFAQLHARSRELEGAVETLEAVRAVLRQDELNQPAADSLRSLAVAGQQILNPPPPPGRVAFASSLRVGGKAEVLARLEGVVAEVRRALDGEGDEVTMVGQIQVTVPGKR